MTTRHESYPARLEIDYPQRLDRLTTALRAISALPIFLILVLVTATSTDTVTVVGKTGELVSRTRTTGVGITGGIFLATALMIVFRERYPRWWYDFALQLTRFTNRVGAYLALLTDRYPSTEDEQAVHLDLEYPAVDRDLNRWLPLVKWLLAIPHYVVLAVLALGALLAVVVAWFSILFSGVYPRALFDYVVGVGRWALRVQAYAFLLVTDEYPPFSLA